MKKQSESMKNKKECGVLCAVSSLPSPYGIGTLGKAAFNFIDLLAETGQSYWQMLPVNHTGYGDSPYAACSVYAGSPYLIDVDILIADGLLTKNDVKKYCGDFDKKKASEKVDYGWLYNTRYPLLKKAYSRYFYRFLNDEKTRNELENFEKSHPFLSDYAKFESLKEEYCGKPWNEWNSEDKNAARREEDYDFYLVTFYKFLQLEFFKQFKAVKDYAHSKGVKIIGDLPIYAALDSSEVWANKSLFELDKNGSPKLEAGVPPDYFSADGQLWGNPVYNVNKIKKQNYAFWIDRIRGALELYDVIRLDHFRGFESYYAIPHGMRDGKVGEWKKGFGRGLIDAMNKTFGTDKFIAEDLGMITPAVKRLLKFSGYPGMKVLQFAFSFDKNNPYLPENITYNSVVYTGTHDNDTLRGWISSLDCYVKDYAREVLGLKPENQSGKNNACENCVASAKASCKNSPDEELACAVIKACMQSRAKIAIVPVQDYLKAGAEGRMNSPSVAQGNWTWRIKNRTYSKSLKKYMSSFADMRR